MKKILTTIALVLVAVISTWLQSNEDTTPGSERGHSSGSGAGAVAAAFESGRSNQILVDSGRVVKVLSDDTKGSQHQRFLVRVADGTTILVAHNIDLAPRVAQLREGDTVRFQGEYEWTAKGGVIHWTHHDPAGRHPGGWIEHAGERYQ